MTSNDIDTARNRAAWRAKLAAGCWRTPAVAGFGAVVFSAACTAHVELPSPPPPHASADEFAQYCDAVRPLRRGFAVTETGSAHLRGGSHRARVARVGIELGNGTLVTDAGDLLPVVGEETTAGRAARAASNAETTADLANIAAVSTFVAGAAVLTIQSLPNDIAPMEQSVRETLFAVGAITLAAITIPLGVLVVAGNFATSLRDDAFRSYEQHFDDARPPCAGGPRSN